MARTMTFLVGSATFLVEAGSQITIKHCVLIMPVSITWILEVGVPLIFSALIIAWFGTILYCIPFQLYLDKRAANTRGRSRDHDRNGK
jgi:hypothetical protein